jgi:hypothetical protein
MKYAIEMDSGVLIYIPNFIKTDSDIQKLVWGDSQTRTQHSDLISFFSFFQNKDSRLKIKCNCKTIALKLRSFGLP